MKKLNRYEDLKIYANIEDYPLKKLKDMIKNYSDIQIIAQNKANRAEFYNEIYDTYCREQLMRCKSELRRRKLIKINENK
jgi:hypothetical protein